MKPAAVRKAPGRLQTDGGWMNGWAKKPVCAISSWMAGILSQAKFGLRQLWGPEKSKITDIQS